ncbi:hypothetical protein [Tumebacillus permanentifrigoris]|uniref:Chromosome segregation ATPase n=1 Tax=Tumebacillus permanentifrigoris TaxID=378543 RepID=A0A316DAN0_9BACL|nr:hypothetical protein [Tumebacillus permanentifrigoris]PWK13457.1 hypothetical protein C7459_107125 [Tumebacillus permanentifrigoris]
MPSINRIRLVNIQYDKGGKQYADELFKLHGKNTLINLANGGGKTLWLQLVMQTQLPGGMMGSRRMVDLLAHERYTGHILVEWKLDTLGEREFLMTGFCFTKASDEEGELKYFTYTHPYRIGDELSIAKMPLVTDGRVIGYQDYYNLLRKEAGVTTFSQHDRRKYIQHLGQYHIYEKEWLSIRTTNGSEGGMDGFFARSKTEQSLLENLLIPTVDQALFQDDNEAQDLANSFLKYKDKLLRIPQIEKNLEEFQEIEAAGRSVVEKVSAYSEALKLRANLEGHLVFVKGRLEELVGEREEEAAALTEVVTALKEQIRDEEFKQASLDVNALQAEYRAAERKLADLAVRLEELAEQETIAEKNVRLYRAIPKYLQIKELEKRLARDRETLAGLDMQNEDLLTEVATYRGQFLTLWEEKKSTLQADLVKKQGERETWKQAEATAEQEHDRVAAALNELSKSGGELENWFKQFDKQQAAVRDLLGEEIAAEPTAERDNLRWQELESNKKVRETETQVEAWDAEIESVQKEIETQRDELRKAMRDQDKLEGKIEQYETQRAKVADRLELVDLARSDLHGSRADLELKLTEKREAYAAEYNKLAAKKGAQEEKKALLSNADYYVPSQELLRFQSVLSDWGIDAMLGSQWLQGQEPSLREQQVRTNPMLPYALLLADPDMRKLRDPRLDWEGLYLESLIPLLTIPGLVDEGSTASDSLTSDSAGSSSAGSGSISRGERAAGTGALVSLGTDTAYLSLHGGYSPFLSQEALDRRRAALDAEMATLVETMDVVEKSRRHIEQVADELGRFFDAYKKNPMIDWQTKRDALQLKVAEKNETITTLTTRITDLRTEISDAKKAVKETQEQLITLRDQLRVLDPLATLASERADKEAARKAGEEQAETLQAQLKDQARIRHEARDQETRIIPAIYALESEEALLKKEREQYLGSAEITALPPEEGLTYDTVSGKLDSLEGLLAQKSVGRDELVRLIQNHEESVRDNQAYIDEQNISAEDLASHNSAPPASELKFWEVKLKESRTEQKQVNTERTDLQADQKKIEGKIETEEKKVKKDFDRAPFAYGDSVDLGAERDALKQLLSDLWNQRKSNEQALDEIQKSREEAKTLLQKADTLLSAYSIETQARDLPEDRAQKLEVDPTAIVTELDKSLQRTAKQTEERRREMEDEFFRFERSIDKYESKIVQKFIRSVIDSKAEGDMSDIEQVRPVFEKCFEMMRLYVEKANLERQELEEAKEELVHRCLQHAERVYDNLKQIAQYTKIDYRGKKVQAIDIQLKDKWESPVGLKLMSQYLHALTEELQQKVSKGEDEDDVEKWLTVKLSSKHLLNVVAPISEARIKVFKPQQVPGEKVRYDHWSEIMKWSGGEQYTGCFAMFIAVLSYLRAKMSGLDNASKVLLADNPFGVVSSPHLLQVIFQLARVNRVQMICLSDHNKQSIYDLFEVVYSLKLVAAMGRSVIQSSERRPESVMEAGFYEIDFDQEVETEQKSLLL